MRLVDSFDGRAFAVASFACAALALAPAGATTPDAGWRWQHGRHELHALAVHGQELWAVGEMGAIVHSTDAGITWRAQPSGVLDDLLDVRFHDADHGWAVGAAGTILATTDSGASWVSQASPLAVDLRGIAPLDPLRVWIGAGSSLLASLDGGTSWDDLAVPGSTVIRDLHRFDAHEAVVVSRPLTFSGGAKVLRTTDGGTTFAPTTCSDLFECFDLDEVQAFTFLPDGSTGVFVGGYGEPIIYRTADRADSQWEQIDTGLPSPRPGLAAVHFVDGERGWAAGQTISFSPWVLRTTDAGVSWQPAAAPDGEDVAFTSPSRGVVVGFNEGASSTDDGGVNWEVVPQFAGGGLYGVDFANGHEGWAVGEDESFPSGGLIIHTTDGGETWEVQRQSGDRLRDVTFLDADHGWAVGHNGAILATDDGGETWMPQTAGTNYHLFGISMVDAQHGWIAGTTEASPYNLSADPGKVWRTTNGGVTWTEVAHFTGWNVKLALAFRNLERGFVVGNRDQAGAVHRTTDGGLTWHQLPLGGPYPLLRNLAFVDDLTGWVVGNDGFVARTTDGGDSWLPQATGISADLYAVRFFDAVHGLVVGGDAGPPGVVLRTTDGGATWIAESTGGRETFYDLAFPSPARGWVSGARGLVRRYTQCNPSAGDLCLGGGRFAVTTRWRRPSGETGTGTGVALTDDTGYFWFFNPSNVEMVLKVLDACSGFDRFWVFAGGLTNVEVEIVVTDTLSGAQRTYVNPQRTQFQPIQDTQAFTCDDGNQLGPVAFATAAPGASDAVALSTRARAGALAVSASGACTPSDTRLCLNADRFAVEVSWERPNATTGVGHAVALTPDTGYFWFFAGTNVEMVIKVLSGCGLNQHYWVFAAGLTNVRVDILVTDTATGTTASYTNPLRTQFQPIQDTQAFASCP